MTPDFKEASKFSKAKLIFILNIKVPYSFGEKLKIKRKHFKSQKIQEILVESLC